MHVPGTCDCSLADVRRTRARDGLRLRGRVTTRQGVADEPPVMISPECSLSGWCARTLERSAQVAGRGLGLLSRLEPRHVDFEGATRWLE